jgi:predicted GIY-YIG superfamily endonuclease
VRTKETTRDWSKAEAITLEQYLFVRNGMIGCRLIIGISKREMECLAINKIYKGWFKDYAKRSYPIELIQKVAIAGMNARDQKEGVKLRLRSAFFMGDYDEKFIYLMQTENGLSKIGVSKNPESRIKSIQTGCAYKVYLVAYWKVMDRATLVEASVHKLLKKFRNQGEWFVSDQITPEYLQSLLKCKNERMF